MTFLWCNCIWLDLPKSALHAHNFNVHFSLPLDGHSNRLTVCLCIIAKSMLTESSFFSLSDIQKCAWVDPILPGQTDSWQGITIWLGVETGDGFSYILDRIVTIKAYKFFSWNTYPTTLWPPSTIHPYRSACHIDYLVK